MSILFRPEPLAIQRCILMRSPTDSSWGSHQESAMGEPQGPGVSSAAAWEQFCEQLKQAGKVLMRPETPAAEIDRAEGLRYLARLTRVGLDLSFEHSDPDFPVFLHAWNATAKAGADNPDNHYLNATIAGDREYRLTGMRGTARSLRFVTANPRDGGIETGSLRAKDMIFEADGSFEIAVSLDPRPGNWLPLTAHSGLLMVRQNLSDRLRELPATVSITRIGGPATPRPLTVKRSEAALRTAASFVSHISSQFADWAKFFSQQPNRVHSLEGTAFREPGGDPQTCYLHGYWSIGADEALVLQTPVPECEVWSFQINNHWMESLDYRYHQVCVNKSQAKYNPDGSVTLIVAATDPGCGNFLDTAGHRCGMMILRWTRAQSHPIPTCRVEKLATLLAQGRLPG
jgi:hypothetical protein